MSGRAVIFYKCTRIKKDVSNVGCFAETTFGFINADNVNVVRYLNNRECELEKWKKECDFWLTQILLFSRSVNEI